MPRISPPAPLEPPLYHPERPGKVGENAGKVVKVPYGWSTEVILLTTPSPSFLCPLLCPSGGTREVEEIKIWEVSGMGKTIFGDEPGPGIIPLVHDESLPLSSALPLTREVEEIKIWEVSGMGTTIFGDEPGPGIIPLVHDESLSPWSHCVWIGQAMAESSSTEKKRKVDDVEQTSSSSDSKTLVMEKGGSDEFFAQISGGEKNQKRLVVSKFKGTGEVNL
jgi:hypothetical protein